jgi:hypothetical protein
MAGRWGGRESPHKAKDESPEDKKIWEERAALRKQGPEAIRRDNIKRGLQKPNETDK